MLSWTPVPDSRCELLIKVHAQHTASSYDPKMERKAISYITLSEKKKYSGIGKGFFLTVKHLDRSTVKDEKTSHASKKLQE